MNYDDWKSTEPEVYFEPELEPTEDGHGLWPEEPLPGVYREG